MNRELLTLIAIQVPYSIDEVGAFIRGNTLLEKMFEDGEYDEIADIMSISGILNISLNNVIEMCDTDDEIRLFFKWLKRGVK